MEVQGEGYSPLAVSKGSKGEGRERRYVEDERRAREKWRRVFFFYPP